MCRKFTSTGPRSMESCKFTTATFRHVFTYLSYLCIFIIYIYIFIIYVCNHCVCIIHCISTCVENPQELGYAVCKAGRLQQLRWVIHVYIFIICVHTHHMCVYNHCICTCVRNSQALGHKLWKRLEVPQSYIQLHMTYILITHVYTCICIYLVRIFSSYMSKIILYILFVVHIRV